MELAELRKGGREGRESGTSLVESDKEVKGVLVLIVPLHIGLIRRER